MNGALPRDTQDSDPFEIEVTTDGAVDAEATGYAIARLRAVIDHVVEPILFARVRLTQVADPACDRRAIAQVALDINGQFVRAHVAGHNHHEAIDLLQQRLRSQLEHRSEHREAARNRNLVPEPGEWRHGDLPTDRPAFFERPADERELVRHKTYAVDKLTPDEAAFDMEQLDYDFHLYRDLATGEDTLIERHPDHTYRLTRLHPAPDATGLSAVPLIVNEHPAPELTVREAIERANANVEPFVFFADRATGRGAVLYHRYDGHYGLLTAE